MLGNNLFRFRKTKKLNRHSHNAYGKYERNESEPDIKSPIRLEGFYNTTIDELCDRKKTEDTTIRLSKEETEKLKKALKTAEEKLK